MSDLDAPTIGDFLAKWILPSPAPDEYAGIRELCETLGIDPMESPHAVFARLAGPDGPPEPVVEEQKLYGKPGDEILYFDLGEVHEGESWMPFDTDDWPHRERKTALGYSHLEPMPPPGFSYKIEEWSVHSASYHMRDVDDELDRIVEWVCENGMIDEDACEQWQEASSDKDVVAAMQAALDLLASKITHRMADELLITHTVTFDDNGEPLLDGEPMYVKRPPEDI